jgi:hypothetical protein
MSRTITFKTVLATVSVALGIGFLVQIGETPTDGIPEPLRVTVPRAVTVVTNAQANSVFGVPPNSHTLVDHISNVQHVALVREMNTEESAPMMGVISAVPAIDDTCKVGLSTIALAAAMAHLAITAPCHKNADFVISHEGLQFSGRTDAAGHAEVVTPIISRDAWLAVLFDNVEFARTAIYTPDVSEYDRTILQWRGAVQLQLHVLEAGANIGEAGHIWTGSSHTAELATLGQHGFVTSHGTRTAAISYQAQIYSYPAHFDRGDISVTMPVGLMVTSQNCGRLIDVQLIQVVSGRVWVPIDVSIQVPTCDSVGEFTMLPDAIAPYTALTR